MSVVEFSQQPQEMAGSFAGELDERRWSVISFDKCEAAGLTYADAMAMLNDLDKRNVAGLCIVTNTAAARLKTPE